MILIEDIECATTVNPTHPTQLPPTHPHNTGLGNNHYGIRIRFDIKVSKVQRS